MAMGPSIFTDSTYFMAQTIQSLQEQVRRLADNHCQLAIRVAILEAKQERLEKGE